MTYIPLRAFNILCTTVDGLIEDVQEFACRHKIRVSAVWQALKNFSPAPLWQRQCAIQQLRGFIVESTNPSHLAEAKDLAGFYGVDISPLFGPDGGKRGLIFSATGDETENLCLAEMAFEINWFQKPVRICGPCQEDIEETGEGCAYCGHLVFTKPLERRR